MNWGALFNFVGSGLAAAAGAFAVAKQGGATDESAGAAAGFALLTALVQHFRTPPAVVKE